MGAKNFAGQNLNGRSFKGQDLRGADFSGCQLKGCDFSDADLTGADFSGALMGGAFENNKLKLTISYCIGVCFGFFGLVIYKIINSMFDNLYSGWFFWGIVFYVVGAFASASLSLHYQKWHIFLWYSLAALIEGALAGVSGLISIEGAGIGVVAAAGAGAVIAMTAVAFAMAVVGAPALFGAVVVLAIVVRESGVTVGLVAILAWFGVGWYFRYAALNTELLMLLPLRRWALGWRCWGGTQFSGALLHHTDLSEADVQGANFVGAQLHNTLWRNTRGLHLAYTEGTALAPRAVRVLLAEGKLETQNFSHHNLRGIRLAHLNLSDCNFYHADLSDADLRGCNLREANFTEAMVLGTQFDGADLSGTIIDNWSTDKQTQFDGVVCDHVYTRRDKSQRNPPQGMFKPGEFSKLYQEIANTVDFIAHSHEELEALLRAINSIKQQGGDIVIQSLERKNESAVVRTQSDPSIDKAAIYAEVKQEMEQQMRLLQREKDMLAIKLEMTQTNHQKTQDLLAGLVKEALQTPKVQTVNDHSRHIQNSPINQSAVNLGDHSTVSAHIKQVADAELKANLKALQDLLARSPLPPSEKQQAQAAVNDLAQASQQAPAERKSLARRSLAFLKDLREDIGSAAELGVQYGETLSKVVTWFQGT